MKKKWVAYFRRIPKGLKLHQSWIFSTIFLVFHIKYFNLGFYFPTDVTQGF